MDTRRGREISAGIVRESGAPRCALSRRWQINAQPGFRNALNLWTKSQRMVFPAVRRHHHLGARLGTALLGVAFLCDQSAGALIGGGPLRARFRMLMFAAAGGCSHVNGKVHTTPIRKNAPTATGEGVTGTPGVLIEFDSTC